jgi:enolase
MKSNVEPLEYIMKAINAAGYTAGVDFFIAMDPASSEFYNEETGLYELKGEGRTLTSEEMIEYYTEMIDKYPIVSIEDGLAEGD